MAGGGAISAAFKALAEDAAQAGENVGKSIGRFFEDTAEKEDASVATHLAAEEENTGAANAIRPADENLPGGSGGGADGGSGPEGSNPVSRMLNGDEASGGTGGSASGAPEAAGPSGSRSTGEMDTAGDPVDVATGDVVLSQADVTLDGVLPLVLERTHRSSHRTGRWLGRSWVSTFDQRLEVYPDRVLGVFSDGRVLTWPRSDDGEETLPRHGPAWPLTRDGDSWTVTDRQRGRAWRFERAPGHWWAGTGGGQGDLPLASVTDRAGHQITISRDEDGAPAAVTHSGGYRLETRVTSERITALVLGDTTLVRYEYDDEGRLSGVVNSSGEPLRFAYDDAGRLAGWTDRNGHSYSYAYDDLGRCVRGQSPAGALSGTFSYDDEARVTTWTDGAGAVTRYRREDPFGVTGVVDPLGSETRTRRDERGQVTAVTDQLGRVTRYERDGAGNLTAVIRPDGTAARAGYDARGLPVEVTEPDGAVWGQSFDALGNRVAVTAPDGSVTRYSYDEDAHLAAVTEPDGSVTTVACDAAGLPVTVAGPDGAVTRYERDRFGRVGQITDPDGGVTLLAWTPEGRPRSRTLPDGSAESWEWDGEGNLLRHVSPGGAVTSCAYGAFDKPAAVTGPDGTRSEFAYDHEQRLTSVIHAGLAWSYTYDPAGRLASETDYNGAVTRYGWDAAGQLTSKVNAAGQSLAYSYDQAGNLVSQSAGGTETTFAYDAAGRLVSARNPDASVSFSRDALGRVTAENCDGRTVRTSYDAAGRVVARVTPSGAVARWSYDVAGRSAVLDSGGRRLRFGYGASGLETRRDLPGGAVIAQEWDALGRLTGQTLTGPEPSSVLQRRSYSYSPDGLVTGLEDLLAGSRAVGLDAAGRVTSVTGPSWSERYGYDQAGNVTAAAWPSLPLPAAASGWLDGDAQGSRSVSGTLTREAGNVRYRHDAAGRVVTRTRTRISRKPETWRYAWDADGRLTAVTTPDGSSWRYSYDPFGRRVAKEHLAASGEVLGWTLFTWDGPVLAEQELSGSEVTTWDYRPGSFAPVAQTSSVSGALDAADAPQEEIDRRFFSIVTDLAGTPAELVAADGSLAGRQRRTLWGGTAWDSSGASTPLRFPGQYADDETGLHYNNQRYYDPVTGAYLSPDPLGLAPSPNPHAYVPNPYAEIDPLGLMGCSGSSGAPDDYYGPKGLTRVFWSGGDVARDTAAEWAKANNGVTLEMTQAGKDLVTKTADMDWEDAKPLWDEGSKRFAEGASGPVHAFQRSSGVRIGSVWGRVEYPTLKSNPNVTNILYHILRN